MRNRATWIGVLIAMIIAGAGLFITLPSPAPVVDGDPTDSSRVTDSSITESGPVILRDTTAPTSPSIDTLRRRSGLIIPVAGVKPEDLVDTYTAARSQGRTHNAIDIMAAKGTPVIAVATGVIKRKFISDKGGITLYQLSSDSSTIYYYAHLDRYAEGIEEGQMLEQGQVLGYVGDTGNATPGNFHLHFAVWKIKDIKNFWTGEDLNPYLLLRH